MWPYCVASEALTAGHCGGLDAQAQCQWHLPSCPFFAPLQGVFPGRSWEGLPKTSATVSSTCSLLEAQDHSTTSQGFFFKNCVAGRSRLAPLRCHGRGVAGMFFPSSITLLCSPVVLHLKLQHIYSILLSSIRHFCGASVTVCDSRRGRLTCSACHHSACGLELAQQPKPCLFTRCDRS